MTAAAATMTPPAGVPQPAEPADPAGEADPAEAADPAEPALRPVTPLAAAGRPAASAGAQASAARTRDAWASARDPEPRLWRTIVGEVPGEEPRGSVPLWGRWLLGVVCAAVLALIGFMLVPHGNPGGAPAAMPSASTNAAETWLAANLARTTPIQTDIDIVLDLSSAGFSDVSTWAGGPPGQAAALPNAGYLVVTAPIHAAVGAAVTRQDRVSMLPVAVFGSGPTRVQVCQIEPEPAATLAARLSGLAHDETAAEAALMSNPRVHVAPAARRVLAARGLDMRAATVLAQLAANTKVSIEAISQAPAEAAAGRPARALTVSVGQPAALTDTLRMLPAVYAPQTVATRASGQTQIEWPIGLAPAGGFG
jgi:hypothetical protein